MNGEMLFGVGFILLMLMFALSVTVLVVVMMWRIVSKTGYPGIMSLLFIVPLGNIVLLAILAFSEWPVEKEIKAFKHGMPSSQP